MVATVVHHLEQHHGDEWKFFNTPLASSCAECHDVHERNLELRGYEAGATVDGRPRDPNHPWNHHTSPKNFSENPKAKTEPAGGGSKKSSDLQPLTDRKSVV